MTRSLSPGEKQGPWGVLYVLVFLLAVPTLSLSALEKACLPQPLDCDDIYAQGYQTDGVYLIYPSGPSVPVPVFCDMTTEGGKWTVSRQRGLRQAWFRQRPDPERHLCKLGSSSLWGLDAGLLTLPCLRVNACCPRGGPVRWVPFPNEELRT